MRLTMEQILRACIEDILPKIHTRFNSVDEAVQAFCNHNFSNFTVEDLEHSNRKICENFFNDSTKFLPLYEGHPAHDKFYFLTIAIEEYLYGLQS